MEFMARHPSLYCTATAQDKESLNLRTIGSLKNDYTNLKDHNNIKNNPYS